MVVMKLKHISAVIACVVVDQITKLMISMNFDLFDEMNVIDGFFSITYVQNTGAAWSMLEGNMIFFYLITIVALAVMWQYYRSNECKGLQEWAMVLMIGGTLGNFLDRIRLQYVVDFLDFVIFGYDFPVFNMADTFLCIGVGLLLLSFILESVKKHEAKQL